jgi:hypothetical protein
MQRFQLGVHVVHESVEMPATAFGEGQALEKQIHHPGLATPDTSPEIEAANGLSGCLASEGAEQAAHERRVGLAGSDQTLSQVTETIDYGGLHGVGAKAALGHLLSVESA